jgi:hypothetical protein
MKDGNNDADGLAFLEERLTPILKMLSPFGAGSAFYKLAPQERLSRKGTVAIAEPRER